MAAVWEPRALGRARPSAPPARRLLGACNRHFGTLAGGWQSAARGWRGGGGGRGGRAGRGEGPAFTPRLLLPQLPRPGRTARLQGALTCWQAHWWLCYCCCCRRWRSARRRRWKRQVPRPDFTPLKHVHPADMVYRAVAELLLSWCPLAPGGCRRSSLRRRAATRSGRRRWELHALL